MKTRRMLAGGAVALAAFVSVAGPAVADDGYPLTRPEQETAVQGVKTPTQVAGVNSGSSVQSNNSGLARTGADLAPLWGGLGLVLAGGALVMVSRRRNPTS